MTCDLRHPVGLRHPLYRFLCFWKSHLESEYTRYVPIGCRNGVQISTVYMWTPCVHCVYLDSTFPRVCVVCVLVYTLHMHSVHFDCMCTVSIFGFHCVYLHSKYTLCIYGLHCLYLDCMCALCIFGLHCVYLDSFSRSSMNVPLYECVYVCVLVRMYVYLNVCMYVY